MSHQQLAQPLHSATLQGRSVPQSTCRTVGLGVTYPSLSQWTLDTNHTPVVPACSTCPCSFTSVVAPNALQSLDDGVAVRIGHRIPVSVRVQHVISIIHCALQQSIERDERTVNIMNLIVSDNQRWNFITPSWIVALHSVYEETSHIIESLFYEFGRTGDQSTESNFTGLLAPDSSTPGVNHSPLCFTLHFA